MLTKLLETTEKFIIQNRKAKPDFFSISILQYNYNN